MHSQHGRRGVTDARMGGMPDDTGEDALADMLEVRGLAEYAPQDAPASEHTSEHEDARDDSHRVRPLTDFLATLNTERAPGDAGGVPVPDAWKCVRAVLGGASRADLEDAHAPRAALGADTRGNEAEEQLRHRAADGTHLPPGLHIVTGQTGGGKSALAMNLAHAAITAGHPVLYVSLELDGGELAARLVSLETGLPWSLLALHRALRPDDRERRARGIAALSERAARFHVLAPVQPLPHERIRHAAVTLWREHGEKTPLVIFDYLQAAAMLDAGARYLPLREHIGAVTMELRALSRADMADGWRGCPVVVLSTTARMNVKGEGAAAGMDGKAPDKLRFADLETLKALPKEAGEVEATAVTAWVVALGEKAEQSRRRLTLRLAKNRLGPPGQWIPFTFDGATGRLTEEPTRYATTPAEEEQERAARDDVKSAKGNGKKRPAVSGPPDEEEAF